MFGEAAKGKLLPGNWFRWSFTCEGGRLSLAVCFSEASIDSSDRVEVLVLRCFCPVIESEC